MGKVDVANNSAICVVTESPRKIRNLLQDYRQSGAVVDSAAGKGSHRKITHPKYRGFVILSGKSGDDAKPYQERDFKNFQKAISK